MKLKTLVISFLLVAAVAFAVDTAGIEENGDIDIAIIMSDMPLTGLHKMADAQPPPEEASEEQQMMLLMLLMLLQQMGITEIVIEPQPPPAIEDGPAETTRPTAI